MYVWLQINLRKARDRFRETIQPVRESLQIINSQWLQWRDAARAAQMTQ